MEKPTKQLRLRDDPCIERIFFSLGSSGIMISNLMLFINTLVECVILLGQGRTRYDNAFFVKFSMLYANYVVVSFSKFYHGVSSSIYDVR